MGSIRFGCILITALLLHSPSLPVSRASPPPGSLVFSFVLPSGYYENIPVDTYDNSTTVQYSLNSNMPVSIAFMTELQFQDFNSSNGDVSNSIASYNGTYSSQTLRVAPGSYQVLVYAYGSEANLTVSLTVYPNNPFVGGFLSPPEPTGIASFGLTNKSGIDSPYEVSSTDVIGVAAISAMRAFNASGESVGANPSGVTLQLNSELVVSGPSGQSQVYWCQNTPDFVTATGNVAMADNVWNFSTTGFLSNSSITSEGGGGSVATFNQNGMTQYYYSYEGTNSTYLLPLRMELMINATAEPGTGVLVQFGARASGQDGGFGDVWFDNATIHDPNVKDAYFLTSGNSTTPNGSFYDTELVFGGEANGEETSFTQMASALGLFYANGSSATMSAFPTYFNFGQNTGESADNLRSTYLGDGEVGVAVGAPVYEYGGNASGEFSLPSVESSLAAAAESIRNTTATTTASTTSYSFTTPNLSTGIPEFPYHPLVAMISVATILAIFLLMRRKQAPPPH